MRVIVTISDPSGREPTQRYMVASRGVAQVISWRSPYLVSAGQSVQFGISAEIVPGGEPKMPDARGIAPIVLLPAPIEYWAFDLPTTRPLSAIMRDVVNHGRLFPTHGANCACMDQYIREVRAQATSSVPAWVPDMDNDRKLWEHRMNALIRVRYVLDVVGRNM